MARVDVIVLGAGIVGTSIALQLAKRDVSVALVDRRGVGEETSYGNAGVIEANTIFPPAFPSDLRSLLRIALKRAPEADYHFGFLGRAAPWLWAFRKASRPEALAETARLIRPLYARALVEHRTLAAESGASDYIQVRGWLKVYRTRRTLAHTLPELELAEAHGLQYRLLDVDKALDLEPSLAPVFLQAVLWSGVASVSDPLALTRAYAARFVELGGAVLKGDARTLRRADGGWQVDTEDGEVTGENAVVALGPWSPDVLEPLGIKLPLGIKRGYHCHFKAQGNAVLSRPVLDADNGYLLAPMDQGIRLTTGAEFGARDAPPTPAQLKRVVPKARELFPLGEAIDQQAWLGRRPCFPDSRPVVGAAPRQSGLWLAYGHAHWGLTLGPASGRMLAEMMVGEKPFCDPAPYRAERFAS
jgi:D-amino-acid dehydrogenase